MSNHSELSDRYEDMIDPPKEAFPRMKNMTPSQVLHMGVLEHAIQNAIDRGLSQYYVERLKQDLVNYLNRFSSQS